MNLNLYSVVTIIAIIIFFTYSSCGSAHECGKGQGSVRRPAAHRPHHNRNRPPRGACGDGQGGEQEAARSDGGHAYGLLGTPWSRWVSGCCVGWVDAPHPFGSIITRCLTLSNSLDSTRQRLARPRKVHPAILNFPRLSDFISPPLNPHLDLKPTHTQSFLSFALSYSSSSFRCRCFIPSFPPYRAGCRQDDRRAQVRAAVEAAGDPAVRPLRVHHRRQTYRQVWWVAG